MSQELMQTEANPSFPVDSSPPIVREALRSVGSSSGCPSQSASTSATRYRPLTFFPLAATCLLQSSQYHFTLFPGATFRPTHPR